MCTAHVPAEAGPATPENDEARGQAGFIGDHETPRDAAQYAATGPAAQTAKEWRNLQAECLLAGFRADLLDGDDGRPMLVVSRWALTRSFSAPADARAWLARVTGAPT